MKNIWIMIQIVATLVIAINVFAADGNVVYVSKNAPFGENAVIARAVANECDVPARQIEMLQKAAGEDGGVIITIDDSAVKARKGRVLQIEILDAISSGNAFVGHAKQITLRGKLTQNGTVIGSFTAIRSSGGGVFGEFKGSCAVLDRCMFTLGKDIVQWLKNPGMNARLGE